MDLKQLQTHLSKKELDLRIKFHTLTMREKDILAKTVKLTEEVGELANDILATLSIQRKSKLEEFDKTNLYQEVADIIISTIVLANILRVDVDRAVKEKMEKIVKVYSKDREK